MTDEERNILTEDLFGRLAHEVVIKLLPDDDEEYLFSARINGGKWLINDAYYVDEVRPYLRPMDSMTDEERDEIIRFTRDPQKEEWTFSHIAYDYLDWLTVRNFDFRGLIGMGLALPATNEMYEQ